MRSFTMGLLMGLVICGFLAAYATALQCYTCENCLEDEELTELHICGELPTSTSRPFSTTRRPAAEEDIETTTTKTPQDDTTKKPNDDSDSEDSDDESDSEDEDQRRTTLRPTNIRSTTTTTTTERTTTTSTKGSTTTKKANKDDDDSDESDDSDEDDDDDRRRRKRHVMPKMARQSDAVCYMVKILVNNSIVTKRGCTEIKANNFLTCEALNDADDVMEDCQLCDSDGCNKFRLDSMESGALWNGANTPSSVMAILSVVLYFLMRSQ